MRTLFRLQNTVFLADASDGPYSNERSGASVKTARENGERRLTRPQACEARALHTRGSRLRRFPPSETSENDCFAVYTLLNLKNIFRMLDTRYSMDMEYPKHVF